MLNDITYVKCLVQSLAQKCPANGIHIYSLFYIRQLQTETIILNTCLSAPRSRNMKSQKNFRRWKSKNTLVAESQATGMQRRMLIKKELVSTTSSFSIPAKHKIWKHLIQRRAENYRDENRSVWEWVEEGDEGSLKVSIQHPQFSSSTSTH